MMNFKKVFSLFVAAVMATAIAAMAGCGKTDDKTEQLAAPQITLSGNVISWGAVEHADGYVVKEGATEVASQTELSYTVNKTAAGSYTYTVLATSTDKKYSTSTASNPVTYTVPSSSQQQQPTAQDTSTKFNGKIYLVGDSTVCEFSDSYYIPRYGYGTQIYKYVNMDAGNVKNLALSGRSSWSYTYDVSEDPNNAYDKTEGISYYEHLTSSLSSGDYLFIGFGHNDEKDEVKRYTDPTLSSSDTSTIIGTHDAKRTVSFKYVLKHYYIDVAKAAGATPVLCTPISRLYVDGDKAKYDTEHVTVTKSATDVTSNVTTTWNGGDYAQAIKELATEEQLLCIDLTSETVAEYKALGYAEAVKYHAATGAKWADESKTVKEATGIDKTHTNLYGAKMNAYRIASAVKASNLPLAASIKTNVTKPTYAENAEAMTTDFTITEKEPFKPSDASTVWNITGTTTDTANAQAQYKWYGTSFGKNAKPNSSYFTMTQSTDADGLTFTLKAESNSKIESSNDSIGAVFIQVPFETAFTVSATATVKSFGKNQAGFGIMLRDDIYIDHNAEVSSNYVAAGCYGTSSQAIMCFARNNGTLLQGDKEDVYPAANSVYDLSIARTSQSITANMGTHSYSAVSDFDLAASDSEYVYICLWVARGTEVTFSKITFTSDTWVQA